MFKIRGFEKISLKQYNKDFKKIYKKLLSDGFTENKYCTYEEIKLPKRATAKSAGYDIYSPLTFKLFPKEEIKLPTGIKAYMQNDEVLKIYPRSSLGFKYYCRLANSVAIIYSDYYNNSDNEGHIWIKIRNESEDVMCIKKGEAFCQAIFEKYLLADGDSFEGKTRVGGLGSTSNK